MNIKKFLIKNDDSFSFIFDFEKDFCGVAWAEDNRIVTTKNKWNCNQKVIEINPHNYSNIIVKNDDLKHEIISRIIYNLNYDRKLNWKEILKYKLNHSYGYELLRTHPYFQKVKFFMPEEKKLKSVYDKIYRHLISEKIEHYIL